MEEPIVSLRRQIQAHHEIVANEGLGKLSLAIGSYGDDFDITDLISKQDALFILANATPYYTEYYSSTWQELSDNINSFLSK